MEEGGVAPKNASFSKAVAMSCTAAIPSSQAFSPSCCLLSYKVAFASTGVRVRLVLRASGTPLRPLGLLHIQIRDEL